MLTYHFIISGKVQGVGYRYTAYLNAIRLGVKGSVRNLDNGDVEVFAQGDIQKIEIFKKYLEWGSFVSRVDSIFEELILREEIKEFQIK